MKGPYTFMFKDSLSFSVNATADEMTDFYNDLADSADGTSSTDRFIVVFMGRYINVNELVYISVER